MKKLAAKRWARVLAAVLFVVFLLLSTAAAAAINYGRVDGWYQMSGEDGFEKTNSGHAYVSDALWYVVENVRWREDLSADYFGSYGGDAFSYVIRDGGGSITADTRTGRSVYVYSMDGKTYDDDALDFTADGYINLPVQPFDGCYSEYILFQTLFSMRYVMFGLKYIFMLLAALAALILIFGAAKRGREGRLPSALQRPFDAMLVGELLVCVAVRMFISHRFMTWIKDFFIRYVGTYPNFTDEPIREALIYLLTMIAVAFALWYMAGQMGAGILREKCVSARYLNRVSLTAVLLTVLGIHIVILFINRYGYGFGFYITVDLSLMLIGMDVILAPILISYSRQAEWVRQAARELSAGNLTYKTDTEKLHFIWRLLGEDLNRIGDGMSQAVEDRLKSERMKTELITNVSHDLKTPLTSIINYIDLLKSDTLDSETRAEYLAILDRQSAKLKKLTEDVVEASKAASGAVAVHYEPINAVELLQQFVGEYSGRMEAAEITPILLVPEEETFISADSALLGRVIENLITNILKYAQPGTRAYFDLTRNGNQVFITAKNVSREPLNITAEELMERFVRGDSSRHSEGSGLGLSIARSLTELMGGTLRLILDGDLFKAELSFKAAEAAKTPAEMEDGEPAEAQKEEIAVG